MMNCAGLRGSLACLRSIRATVVRYCKGAKMHRCVCVRVCVCVCVCVTTCVCMCACVVGGDKVHVFRLHVHLCVCAYVCTRA
jgi:hypothetical protein